MSNKTENNGDNIREAATVPRMRPLPDDRKYIKAHLIPPMRPIDDQVSSTEAQDERGEATTQASEVDSSQGTSED